MDNTNAAKLKRDLQASIQRFSNRSELTSTVIPNSSALQTTLTDQQTTVRIQALLNLIDNRLSLSASSATLERLVLSDSDEVVRGLALLRMLQSPGDIDDPSLRDFVEQRGAIADEFIEILSIIRDANEDLHASRLSLSQVAELTESLTSRK